METAPAAPAVPSEQPPYGNILLLLKQGKVIPFLGAGASLTPRAPGEEWSPKSSTLPTGRDLAAYLAMLSEFPATDPQDREDLARVASYSVDSSGEDRSVSSKLHGTVWPPDEALDNFMITEEGSGEFLSRMTANASSAVPAQAV